VPELPDIVVYLEALERRILGRRLAGLRLASPFVLRSVDPPVSALAGRRVLEIRRMGKRLVLGLEGELFVVIHLMIAGRLRWAHTGAKPPGRIGLAAFDFEEGTLLLTEAGSKRRASLHLVGGVSGLERLVECIPRLLNVLFIGLKKLPQ
jgi:formamidopyrimidine-DNA glycosylase